MKIYFEIGRLFREKSDNFYYDYAIDAGDGIYNNLSRLYAINFKEPNSVIYTNSILLISGERVWNNENKKHELYFFANNELVNVHELTSRELRRGHNLAKLLISGEFDEELNKRIYGESDLRKESDIYEKN